MKQLEEKKVNLLNALYEYEKISIAEDNTLVTQEETDHYLLYYDEYQKKPIVYLSIHGEASKELVEKFIKLFKQLNCVVRYYDAKIKKWDSYDIKNADLTVVFPFEHNNEFILGKGTENECNLSMKYDNILVMGTSDITLETFGDITKRELVNGEKVDWLNTAKIENIDVPSSLSFVINRIKENLLTTPRKIYIKEDKNIVPV